MCSYQKDISQCYNFELFEQTKLYRKKPLHMIRYFYADLYFVVLAEKFVFDLSLIFGTVMFYMYFLFFNTIFIVLNNSLFVLLFKFNR